MPQKIFTINEYDDEIKEDIFTYQVSDEALEAAADSRAVGHSTTSPRPCTDC